MFSLLTYILALVTRHLNSSRSLAHTRTHTHTHTHTELKPERLCMHNIFERKTLTAGIVGSEVSIRDQIDAFLLSVAVKETIGLFLVS